MTTKSDFTPEEWKMVQEGPVTAGMVVLAAESGGTFRETFALAGAFNDARRNHGESELLDELVASKPQFDRHRYGSPQELHDEGLKAIGEASALVRAKADAADAAAYDDFVVTAATAVANAHKEHGQAVSPKEQAALEEVRARLAPSSG